MLRIYNKGQESGELLEASKKDGDRLFRSLPAFKKEHTARETEAARRIALGVRVLSFLRGGDPKEVKSILAVLDELRASIKLIQGDPEALDFSDLTTMVHFLENT